MNPAVDLWSNIIAMELPSSHIPSLLEPFLIEPTCANARWAHMHRFLSVCLSVCKQNY